MKRTYKRLFSIFLAIFIVYGSFFAFGDPFATVYADKETGTYKCILDKKRDGWMGITHDLTNIEENAVIGGDELNPAELKFYGKGKFSFTQPVTHRRGNEIEFPEFTVQGNFYNLKGERQYENSLLYYNESYAPKVLDFGRYSEGSDDDKLVYNHKFEITSVNTYWTREVTEFDFNLFNPFEMFRWEMEEGYIHILFNGNYTRTNSTDTKRYPNMVNKPMVIRLCYKVPDIEHSTLGLGALMIPSGLVNQVIDTNAEEMPNTVTYSNVSTNIIEGVQTAAAAGAVAVGAGAVVSALDGGSDDDERRRSTYRMATYKNFGDTLYPNKTENIFAKMVETDIHGSTRDRPDLSTNIRIVSGSEAVDVLQTGMSGEWNGAQIRLSGAVGEPIVTFIYEDIGGSFRNNVHFKVNDPQIRFWEWSEEEQQWYTGSYNSNIKMVTGCGGRDVVPFVFINTTEEPKTIEFFDTDGFRVTYVSDLEYAYTYRATVENFTHKMDKIAGIFTKGDVKNITIRAEFPSGAVVQSYFSVYLYPDGLSVYSDKVVDEHLLIDTNEDPTVSEGYEKIPPVYFTVCYSYVGSDGRAVIIENRGLSFGNIEEYNRYGNTFKGNFRYRIANMDTSGIMFASRDTLPVISDPYQAYLPLSFSDGQHSDSGQIPLAFIGETPAKPSNAEWDTAYAKLKKAIEIFGISNDSQTLYLLRNAHSHSASELEFTRYWIILTGKQFYKNQSREYQEIDAVMKRYIVVTSAFVKAGDKAIEMILRFYFPTGGATAAAFINPLKNMLANFIGQYIGPGSEWNGSYEDLDFFKGLLEGMQAGIGEAMTGGDIKIEKMGYIVAAYLMTAFVNHYYYGRGINTYAENIGNEKGDIYRSMIAAVGDLGLAKFKAWLGKQIEKLTESGINHANSLIERIGKWFAERMNKLVNNAASNMIRNAGMQTFTYSVRQAYATGGTLTTAGYQAAHGARLQTEELIRQNIKKFIDASAGYTTTAAQSVVSTAHYSLGVILNYLMNGTIVQNDSLGICVDEVLTEFLVDRLGITVTRVYHAATNPLVCSFRIENGVLYLGMLDYVAEIPLMQNLITLTDILMEFCFGWMENHWKGDSGTGHVPDSRDELSGDTELVEQMKRRLDELEPVTISRV